MPEFWKFYAAPMSYFSAKIRPVLRYKRIDFVEIRPTPDVYRRVIVPRTGLGFIPVVITDKDEVLQDTPRMYERIEELRPEPAILPTDAAVRLIAELIQDFSDEAMIVPAMHFRWDFPEQRDWIRADWQPIFGDMSADLMQRMSGSLPMLGVNEQTREAVDAWFDTLLEILSRHFQHNRFLLGDRATIADFALLGPMYAHLGRDPVPAARMRERAPRVMAWLHEANDAAGSQPDAGEPAVADTLMPLLEEIGRVFVPMQQAASNAADQAAAGLEVGEAVPRVLGFVETPILGIPSSRYVNSYSVWRHARTATRYADLEAADRHRVDAWLEPAGVLPLLQNAPALNLEMCANKLIKA